MIIIITMFKSNIFGKSKYTFEHSHNICGRRKKFSHLHPQSLDLHKVI